MRRRPARTAASPTMPRRLRARAAAPAARLNAMRSTDADIHLYHLGNNRLHAEIYARRWQRRASWCCMTPCCTTSCWARFRTTVHRRMGLQLRRVAARPRRRIVAGASAGCGRSALFPIPDAAANCGTSRGVIVHNPGAAAIARAQGAEQCHDHSAFLRSRASCRKPRIRRVFASGSASGRVPGCSGFSAICANRSGSCPASGHSSRLHALRPDTALLLAGEVVSARSRAAPRNRSRASRHPPPRPPE